MKGLDRHIHASKLLLPLMALLAAVFCSSLFMALFGYSALSVYAAIISGAMGNLYAMLQTLSQSTVLILTGVSFAVAFKAGMINIGTEGQLYIGAMVAALVGIYVPLPGVIHHLAVILAAALGGGLWAGIAGYLKVKFNAHEVITTIMLNSIAVSLCSYLVNYPLKASELVAQTARLRDTAIIKRVIPQTQFSMTFVLAVLIAVVCYFIIKKTVFGYTLRVVGKNKRAARASGIKVDRMIILSMAFSGAIGGIAGAFQVMGINYRFIDGFSSGFGFSGVAVSALASGNIIGIIFSGVLFGIFKNGAMVVQRISRVPSDFVGVLQAMIIIFVAAPNMMIAIKEAAAKPFRRLRKRQEGSHGVL